MRILIADDDRMLHTMLSPCLQNWGYEVVHAFDGEETIGLLKSDTSIELVLLDWVMPGLDGPTICRTLRKNFQDKSTYILMMTGKDGEEDVRAAVASGADDYLIKPLDLKQLSVRLTVAHRFMKTRRELQNLNDELDYQIQERTKELVVAERIAQNATRRKSEFLANMSHEIRTPLNGIISLASLMLDSELDQQQRDDMVNLLECGQSLKAIIGDILDFSKIEAGKLTIAKAPFQLGKTVRRTVRNLDVQIKGKAQEVICDILPDVPERVIGDSLRVEQVLTNLIGNAIKFTPENGGIYVGVEVQEIHGDDVIVLYRVADTGIGIPEEKQQHVFNAFTQADGSITRRYGGTGLGLTICASLVRMMGGRIWFESEPGVGTTFYFTTRLGLQESELSSIQQHRAATNPRSSLHVLVVEDNKLNSDTMRRLLEKYGYSITLAQSAEEGLRCLEEYDVDVVLSDLQMPDQDGISFAKSIRVSQKGYSKVPLIAVTASASVFEKHKCAQAGFDGFFMKPLDYMKLSYHIEQLSLSYRETSDIPHRQSSMLESGTRPAVSEPLVKLNRVRILLAEDDPVNSNTIARTLARHGCEVTAVENGKEAVEIFLNQSFDLVLTDLTMPVMDGFEAARLIRQKDQKVPIVLLTALAITEKQDEAYRCGMNGFITKPIDYEDLLHTIQELTEA